jgi:hypothetical protein
MNGIFKKMGKDFRSNTHGEAEKRCGGFVSKDTVGKLKFSTGTEESAAHIAKALKQYHMSRMRRLSPLT